MPQQEAWGSAKTGLKAAFGPLATALFTGLRSKFDNVTYLCNIYEEMLNILLHHNAKRKCNGTVAYFAAVTGVVNLVEMHNISVILR